MTASASSSKSSSNGMSGDGPEAETEARDGSKRNEGVDSGVRSSSVSFAAAPSSSDGPSPNALTTAATTSNSSKSPDASSPNSSSTYAKRRLLFIAKVKRAAAVAVHQEDPWLAYNIPAIPAERIIRHEYNPLTQAWTSEETIVKMEKEPFTHGAMRFCYRMKKLATPPRSSSYHRFYKYGWSRASNYVAKAYINADGSVDTSPEAKAAVRNDIKLQYEAARWAEKFNASDPPKKINFIRAWVMEMPDREGSPLFAIERFIAGSDSYGAGFVKHNTNSGFVDLDLHRVTPQVFSAHSFYSSHGTRLVADIQGVGDLFTDPQVLSNDYRFGEGDLGPRGMALFFKTFRHCNFSDSLGIPTFPLSRNEKKHQAKYTEDEDTVSTDPYAAANSSDLLTDDGDDDDSFNSDAVEKAMCRFARLDLNRQARQSSLMTPHQAMRSFNAAASLSPGSLFAKGSPLNAKMLQQSHIEDTEKRGNLSKMRLSVSQSIRQSMALMPSKSMISSSKPKFHRTRSDQDEIMTCLMTALKDPVYDHRAFHRLESGEVRSRGGSGSNRELNGGQTNGNNGEANNNGGENHNNPRPAATRRKTMMAHVVQPMVPDDVTKENLGRVHYHLACLHGIGRFPEIIPEQEEGGDSEPPSHDVFSVVFHLAHAASLRNVSACLSLARVRAGLDTTVSDLMKSTVPVNFESAKDLLTRAMESEYGPSGPRAAAGCLLLQIMEDEGTAAPAAFTSVVQETLDLMEAADREAEELAAQRAREERGGGIAVGDRVEANYELEGTYYPGVVTAVSEDEYGKKSITVQYDDDGSSETHSEESVRALGIGGAPTEAGGGGEEPSQQSGPLTDAEALGGENDDEICLYEAYTLQAKLAELKAKLGDAQAAAELFQEAADKAMSAGKMKTAAGWSQRAAELAG